MIVNLFTLFTRFPQLKNFLKIIAVALVFFFIARESIKLIGANAKKDIIIDIIEDEEETRERIQDAIRTAPRDVNNAVEFLRDRQNRRSN